MTYELSYDKERDLIVGSVEGDIDPVLVKAIASELAGLVASTGCRRLLNDLRKARLSGDAFQIYDMPRIVDQQGVPFTCRRALLISGPSEDYRFLETVSVNACQQVRIFDDLASALEWLGVDAAPQDNQKVDGSN